MARAAEARIIDAHAHIWDRSRFRYHWLIPGSPLDRNYCLEDFAADMDAFQVQGGLLIEATNTPEEIAWLLSAADAAALDWGVIGWLHLNRPSALTKIEHYAQHPRFKGVRLNLLTPQDMTLFDPALAAIERRGLVVDVLSQPDQLASAAALAERFPTLMFVLEHFGGWSLNMDTVHAWANVMQPLADLPNLILKVSGFAGTDSSTLRAYLHAADALFGRYRLIFGSNAPFCPQGYGAALRLFLDACADQPAAWRSAVLRDTARVVYQLLPNGVSV